jgi:hypothetical protein
MIKDMFETLQLRIIMFIFKNTLYILLMKNIPNLYFEKCLMMIN